MGFQLEMAKMSWHSSKTSLNIKMLHVAISAIPESKDEKAGQRLCCLQTLKTCFTHIDAYSIGTWHKCVIVWLK